MHMYKIHSGELGSILLSMEVNVGAIMQRLRIYCDEQIWNTVCTLGSSDFGLFVKITFPPVILDWY